MLRNYRKIERVMEHSNTQALYSYWDELRAGRDAPSRSEIDPRRIAGALETMFILEALNDGQLRIRLAGTALCEMLGMEARGLMVETLMVEDQAHEAPMVAARALERPGPVVMRVRAVDAEGRDWVGEALFLPLRSELGELSRVIGCVNFLGADRRDRPAGPLRLRSQGSRALEVDEDEDGLVLHDPLGAPPARTPAPAPTGFAEPSAPFGRPRAVESAPRDPSEARPTLTAIEGNPDAPRPDKGERPRPSLRIVKD
ncbi:MAG: PAS domain-containing protein [Pseudomonadota bacterium]